LVGIVAYHVLEDRRLVVSQISSSMVAKWRERRG
jgi:hypothetical protein